MKRPKAKKGHEKPLNAEELAVVEDRLAGKELRVIGAARGKSLQAIWRMLQREHVAAFMARHEADVVSSMRTRLRRGADAGWATLMRVARGGEGIEVRDQVSAAKALLAAGIPKQVEISGQNGAPVQTETRIVIVSGSAAEAELDRLADEEE